MKISRSLDRKERKDVSASENSSIKSQRKYSCGSSTYKTYQVPKKLLSIFNAHVLVPGSAETDKQLGADFFGTWPVWSECRRGASVEVEWMENGCENEI